MAPRTTPPFRADHVGSLLRPQRLHQAREDFAAGRIKAEDLRAVEDDAIREVVQAQESVGLQSATDGEFRRATWHMDFIYQLGGISSAADEQLEVHFHNAQGDLDFKSAALKVSDKVRLNNTIFGDHFSFLKAATTAATPKLTIPSPNMVHYRGNFQSSWVAAGGYDFVAEALFGELAVDGFFCEWDDERSGGFEPMRFVPKAKMVVLGLVTTKRGELESKDDLKRRIEDAARFVDIEQLCLSPQCGFSSTVEGNKLTYDDQMAKLQLIVETAQEVWG